MQSQWRATIEDLYNFIAEKPRRSVEMIRYMTKETEERGVDSVSVATTYHWLGILVAEKRVGDMPLEGGRKHKYYHVIDISSVTKEGTERRGDEARRDHEKYGRESMITRSIHALSGREIRFTTIWDTDPHEIELLICAMTDRLSHGYRVDALVLEYYDCECTYYKYAGLFFKDGILEQVCLSKSFNMVIHTDPSYKGSGKQAHDQIESFLDERMEIAVERDRNSLKTYEEFHGKQKDKEVVVDYLGKCGYLL